MQGTGALHARFHHLDSLLELGEANIKRCGPLILECQQHGPYLFHQMRLAATGLTARTVIPFILLGVSSDLVLARLLELAAGHGVGGEAMVEEVVAPKLVFV